MTNVEQVFQQTYGHPLQNGPAGGQGNQPGPNPQQNQQAAGGVAAGRGGGGFGGDDNESSDGDDNNDRRRGGNPGRGHGRRLGQGAVLMDLGGVLMDLEGVLMDREGDLMGLEEVMVGREEVDPLHLLPQIIIIITTITIMMLWQ